MSRFALASVLILLCALLEGCDLPRVEGYFSIGDLNVKTHKIPNWRQRESYWNTFGHQQAVTREDAFNSCMDPKADILTVCSGRGTCTAFDHDDIQNPVFFCKCDEKWGGPECATPRKSQLYAWLISLFLGPLGLDEFYLGWWLAASIKLACTTLGLVFCILFDAQITSMFLISIPWVVDVVRIGSAPIRAYEYKVSGDLPRWAFAVFTLVYTAMIGYVLGVCTVYYHVQRRRRLADIGRYYGTTSIASYEKQLD